ncbi:MAG TPA: DUF2264 domain-containing protein [Arachnia sp.]|nr:DUF2264 domain-containing protein [Arachnia sp.]HMT84753.1 DUF2264 domain-containing protein [Arachnia sp.]
MPTVPTDPTPDAATGREELRDLARRLLRRALDFGSPGHARIDLPGTDSAYGSDVGGLEGFARTFVLAAALVAGDRGHDPDGFLAWYGEGLAAGTDPASDERWVSMRDHSQPKVEAASLAVGLHLTRPWLWDRMDDAVRGRVMAYLEEWIGSEYPPCNWVWFRILTEQFLLNAGSARAAEIERDLDLDLDYVESLYRADGWYSDGAGRHFDHYAGWVMQVYPTLWLLMAGDSPRAARWAPLFRERLSRYLEDAVHLVGADGAPLFQGRSLIYRFAAAAPLWAGVLAGCGEAGQLREGARRIVAHFLDHGAVTDDDRLTLGWFGPWPAMAQHYSGPGSVYWASKGLLGLALPEDSPAWQAPAVALPIDGADSIRAIESPGWIVSGTARDGIVRVFNLGTDHAAAGEFRSDDPLYARVGYSTATAPVLAPPDAGPVDNAIVLLDENGLPSHRTGFEDFRVAVDDGTGIGAWTGEAHWPASGERVSIDAVVIVRGSQELRLVRAAAPRRAAILGWPVTADAPPSELLGDGSVAVASLRLRSTLASLGDALANARVSRYADATPLGSCTAVPELLSDGELTPGRWWGAHVELAGADVAPSVPPHAELSGSRLRIGWRDGVDQEIDLDEIVA